MGELDNTIVVFTTDNGAEAISFPDGGVTPFKGQKGEAWEGGYRAPLVVRWPGHIKPGTVKSQLFASLDWLPTFVDIAGGPKGDDLKEQIEKGEYPGIVKTTLDGVNQRDYLEGKSDKSARDFFFYYSGATPSAVRYKNWKMYYTMAQPGAEGWLLPLTSFNFTLVQNIKRDPFEQAVGVDQKTAMGLGGALAGPRHRLYLRLEHAAHRSAVVAEGTRVRTGHTRRCRRPRATTSNRLSHRSRRLRRLVTRATSRLSAHEARAGAPKAPINRIGFDPAHRRLIDAQLLNVALVLMLTTSHHSAGFDPALSTADAGGSSPGRVAPMWEPSRFLFTGEIMIRLTFLVTAALAALWLGFTFSLPSFAQESGSSAKPNILVIMGDDIGYWNISAYNRGMMGYRTPNIDRIANEGGIFTDYYGQQSCTAGRAAFITGQSPMRTGLLKVGLPGAKEGLSEKDPTLAELLKPLGYVTGQFGKNHLGDRNEFLPTVHGFDEFFGNLYHLNAEDEPEHAEYPKNTQFKLRFGPRGVLRCTATTTDTPGDDPRFGKWGKQNCEDTGPLDKKRMETVDDEFLKATLDFIDRANRDKKPFFAWFNSTRMHIWTRLKPESQGKTGLGLYPDGMVEHDGQVGQLLKKLDDLGIANNTIVIYTTDNGAETFTWPDGGTTPFRGRRTPTGRVAIACPQWCAGPDS